MNQHSPLISTGGTAVFSVPKWKPPPHRAFFCAVKSLFDFSF